MISLSIITAIVMGLTGSLHCAGMCGPIIWFIPFHVLQGHKKWIAILLYHTGRISTYALLGWVLYAFKSIFNPHWQQYIAIGAGVILLIAGLWSFMPGRPTGLRLPWSGLLQQKLGTLMMQPSWTSLFLAGILNGMLPCGLVYMALSLSVAADSATQAILLMYAFGAGTMPMLTGITILRSRTIFFKQIWIRKWIPVVLFFFGSVFILRGMNLGIPYLSPQITMENQEVKARCCHKPVDEP